MRVMLIDDEQPGIDELSYLLGKYPDIEIAGAFTNPLRGLEAVERVKPDAVFLDIDMPHADGLELALRIQSLQAGIIVVFVTAYAKYALDSFKAYPLDYLLKPVKEARLDATVEHMRRVNQMFHPDFRRSSSLHIRCFGRFEIAAPNTGADIKWGTRRVKELLMYLIDLCGAVPTRGELVRTVFGGADDKKTANNIYVTIYKLRGILDGLDPERRLIRLRDDYSLEVSPGICDYLDFMSFARQNPTITQKNAVAAAKALNRCGGGYLEGVDYPWAADTASVVEAEYERISLGLARVHLNAGRSREAENVLQALLTRDPLSEEGHTALLDLYMRNGSDSNYRSAYLEYARILKNDLGEEPSPAYTRHYREIESK
ncbi:MAG: response regulator [Firmicutes bacterium]|nr:response regulator [Bacillota bacterium]